MTDDPESRPKLVHRLDKDTSGALLVARTARAAGHFAKAFSGRTARKVYWAIVTGVLKIFLAIRLRERISAWMASVTSQTLTFIPATTRPP